MACLRSKNFISVWIIFLFYRCSYSIGTCPRDGQSIFLTEPRDVTVKEGNDVSFSCTAKSLLYLPIEWEVSPEEPMKEVVLQDTTSRLLVYNVGRVDRYITCKVYDRQIDDQNTCSYSSRLAKMTVQYFPREDELTCSTPNRSLSIQEGESFHIHCQVTRGNPPVDIGWSMDGKTFRQNPATDEVLTRTSAQIIKIIRGMHGLSFTCVVTSEVAFSGEEITCSIGPLDVNVGSTHDPTTDGTEEDYSSPSSLVTHQATLTSSLVTHQATLTSSLVTHQATLTSSLVTHQGTLTYEDIISDSVETSSDTEIISNQTSIPHVTAEVWWKRKEALVVVFAVSGALLVLFLTTMTLFIGINRCKSTQSHLTEQGENSDVEHYRGRAPFPGTTRDDFKVVANSKTVKEPEQALEKVAVRENAHQIVLNKNSSQNDHTTRTSLRYSDVWSSVSSLSDSSATLEDVAVPLKRDRELPGHVSYGNKFLVDLEDVYVIQKLNSRRSSLGLLFLNPSEPTGELRHFTLPRQSGPISLPITETTKTDDLRKDSLPSRNYPTAAALLQTPQGPGSTSPLQRDPNQHNSETSKSEDNEEMYLHEETKL